MAAEIAIPLDILAQIAAAFSTVAALAIIAGSAIGIAARFSEPIHQSLCRIDAYLSDDASQKGYNDGASR